MNIRPLPSKKFPPRFFGGQGTDAHRLPGLVKYEPSLPVVLLINLTSVSEMRNLLVALEVKERTQLIYAIDFTFLLLINHW